ncbi:reverse transcriptase domain-containing protein [Marinobacter alkaliphilus]|uniref:reverse transcriptase domain-containing protein n=1 Tax=Marinobacter alkaliphilus TaxID=254719 RepID=UPI003D811E89|nr:reverse transcriptase domain-containing protein [Marinobacter alkaliphilus]
MTNRFEDYLSSVIEQEAKKLIERYHSYHNFLHLEHERNKARIYDAPEKVVKKPNYWNHDNNFNPFHVRKKAKSIAKSITKKLADGTYSPREPYQKPIDKPGGGTRVLSIYQLPDVAVSRIFYERLLEKNRHRFSSFSYAYRNDKNVHFAIQDISVDLSLNARAFVAEFDFSDFFGSISHEYLREQFDCNGFYISEEERKVIDAFLEKREVGIPQGTSISLFLANLVCWKLDRTLEGLGVRFARYADDTVIWSSSYQKVCDAFTAINDFSTSAGVKINAKKSEGISLLTREGLPSELSSTKSSIEFLGYGISVDAVSIKPASVEKIQSQISYILYKNLIQPLKGPKLKSLKIPSRGKDEALLSAMMQIRRYLYGGLTSYQLESYISGRTKRIKFKGIMSFYPLVDDFDQLKHLDGWLVSTIFRSLRLRSKLLIRWKFDRSAEFPFNVKRDELVETFRARIVHGKPLLEVPSFLLIQKALQLGLKSRGIEGVMNPKSNEYNY